MPVFDVSAALRPGVYVLWDGARVVWIGKVRRPAERIYAHLVQKRGQILPGMPKAPVTFDRVEITPCTVDNLGEVYRAVCSSYGWVAP